MEHLDSDEEAGNATTEADHTGKDLDTLISRVVFRCDNANITMSKFLGMCHVPNSEANGGLFIGSFRDLGRLIQRR